MALVGLITPRSIRLIWAWDPRLLGQLYLGQLVLLPQLDDLAGQGVGLVENRPRLQHRSAVRPLRALQVVVQGPSHHLSFGDLHYAGHPEP